MSNQTLTTPTHDKHMARDFLAGLDPKASRFTFQFFSERKGEPRAEVFHGTLDEVWPKVQRLNTPQGGVGVFVTISETDLKGRRTENIVRPRALFVDADSKEQVECCVQALKTCGVTPSMIVKSGRGHHFYFCADDIPRDQFSALQKSLIEKVGTDAAVHDLPRVMRLPGTLHLKNPANPQAVKLLRAPVTRWKLSDLLAKLGLLSAGTAESHGQAGAGHPTAKNGLPSEVPTASPQVTVAVTSPTGFENGPPAAFAHLDPLKDSLSAGIKHEPLDPRPILAKDGCPFFRDALATHGKSHTQPLWNLTILATTFWINGEGFAHALGKAHPDYTPADTDAMYARKMKERTEKGLGWPSCTAIQSEGCKLCATCKHFGKIKSPLNLAYQQQTQPAEPSFVDPYAEFVGPKFPLDVLPLTLAKFVDAEHRAMGADPSAIAMAVLTTVAGAMNAETRVRAGEGWFERPILWTALVGQPSTMKSPIIVKATKPLSRIDQERAKHWQQEYAIWQQSQK